MKSFRHSALVLCAALMFFPSKEIVAQQSSLGQARTVFKSVHAGNKYVYAVRKANSQRVEKFFMHSLTDSTINGKRYSLMMNSLNGTLVWERSTEEGIFTLSPAGEQVFRYNAKSDQATH